MSSCDEWVEQARAMLCKHMTDTDAELQAFIKPYKRPDGSIGEDIRKSEEYKKLNARATYWFQQYRAFNKKYKPPKRTSYNIKG